MTDIVERLRLMLACDPGCEGRCMDCPTSVAMAAADEIERMRAAVEAARQEGFVVGGEEALLHALHPEFGSIYAEDGEATAVHKAGRREGIEAAAKVCDERSNAEMQTLSDGKKYYRPHADRREAKRCAASIRALLEGGRC